MRKTSRSKYRLVQFILLTILFASAAVPALAQNDLLSRKMVWACEMTCFPMTLYKTGGNAYGSLYPLDMAYFYPTAKSDAYTNIQDAIGAGVDGFDVDIFTSPESITGYLSAADSINANLPSEQPPFLIAPCLDIGVLKKHGNGDTTIDNAVIATIEKYCILASTHPSAAREGESFVIFNYSTASLPERDWLYVRSQLLAAGYPTYWIANVGTWDLSGQSSFPTTEISQYFPAFESGFIFGEAGQWWPNLLSQYATYSIPFAGGITPGYNHEDSGYLDAKGTAFYRGWWEDHLDANLPWVHIATWNDLTESTQILPTSDWNVTRSDLTAFSAAQFRGDAPPFADPRLYITTPQGLAIDQSSIAEALVLNPTADPCTATIQLYDGNGNPYGGKVAQTLPPGQGYVDVPVDPNAVPAEGFLLAKASLSMNGESVAQVTSAPIIVYPKPTGYFQSYAGKNPRIQYYSIPASAALPGAVKLSVDVQSGGLTAIATITPPSGASLRFVELLHNTLEVYNFADVGPFTIKVPTGHVVLGNGGTLADTSVAGYYVARVTDKYGRVGYSNPVVLP